VNQRRLLAQRLRRLRKAARLSLDKAGEKGGLSGKYWGEVERSEKSPTLEKVGEMARALGVPLHVLVQIEREDEDEKALRKKNRNYPQSVQRKAIEKDLLLFARHAGC
jgi:transcriptional regulator with XRE-family HTH domain